MSLNDLSIKLSIIVPVYKTELFLRMCLDSILGQTFENFELILIEDGSPDKSAQICDEYACKDARIKVVHQKNAGLAYVRKVGIDLARGKYIGFVDSDDYIHPEMFLRMVKSAEQYNADTIICDWFICDVATGGESRGTQMDVLSSGYLYSKNEMNTLILPRLLLETLHGYSWNKLYKASILKRVDLARTIGLSNNQDWVLNCEYFKESGSLFYLNEPLYYYNQHSAASLRGVYKDYPSLILRLHSCRMLFLEEFGFLHNDVYRRQCIERFIVMIKFAVFDYEFLFPDISFFMKIGKIDYLLNQSVVKQILQNERNISGSSLFGRIQTLLLKSRRPFLILGFVILVKVLSSFKKLFVNVNKCKTNLL